MKFVTGALYGVVVFVSACLPVLAEDKNLFIAQDNRVLVKVSVSPYPSSQPCLAAASWRWGAENSCPKNTVTALEVKVDGVTVFVPVSGFLDLGNPKSVRIDPSKEDRTAITIVGGDAATSYAATLELRGHVLAERVVRHGEFPDESFERTIYGFNIQE